jgi:subtilase family serine protease
VPGRTVLAHAVAALAILIAAPAASALPHSAAAGLSHRPVCGPAAAGTARCHSDVVTDRTGAVFHGKPTPGPTAPPAGLWPADLRSAYKLTPPTGVPGSGPTIAIVDAFDDPNAEADLAVYRNQFGLGSCTTANGCFKKVNQNGVQGAYPRSDAGWAQEISLDLDMASAICPNCRILLVEASTNAFTNLFTGVDTAARLGAATISNSYGGSEFSGEDAYESHYNHPGVTVSSGDNGFGAEFPASSRFVTAVGGTTLRRDASARGWSESVWSGSGSGCSAYIAKPAWQTDAGCARRTVADVSAVADPATGVAVYDSFRTAGWLVFGGTSASAPIVAGVYALAGNTAGTVAGSYPYGHAGSLFDVMSGSNGSCGGTYLCTGLPGYDGPTGLGTPNGSGAF